jgi:putative hydrolase of the HAD superfamily
VRVGIISAGLRVKQAEKLLRLGLLPWIDPTAIFFSDQMGVSKPNPKIYLKACEALKVLPRRALYVGDRHESDVVPARQAGLKTAHYHGAHGRYSDAPGGVRADHEVELLTELLPVLREVYALPVEVPAATRAGG